MPEPRVPLAQRLLEALPGRHEALFHVEHSPVEELPTNLRRSFQQTETVRVDQLQRQRFGKLRSAPGIFSVDTNLKFALTIPRYPQIALATFGKAYLAEHSARRLLVLNDRLQPRTAERTGKTEKMNGLKQAGLSAAVGAVEDIDTRGGGEGHRVQVTHRGDRDTTKRHLRSAGYRRIGITT
ncbi:hypothetical protein D9M73_141910 [compost metagenome]